MESGGARDEKRDWNIEIHRAADDKSRDSDDARLRRFNTSLMRRFGADDAQNIFSSRDTCWAARLKS